MGFGPIMGTLRRQDWAWPRQFSFLGRFFAPHGDDEAVPGQKDVLLAASDAVVILADEARVLDGKSRWNPSALISGSDQSNSLTGSAWLSPTRPASISALK